MDSQKRVCIIAPTDLPKINWRRLNFQKSDYIFEIIDTYGPDILYTVDESGFLPIHWAVINGNLEIMDKMLKAGVSPRIKAKIYDEPEPIHLAALEGHIHIIDLLISNGIDVNVKDRSGCTPLMRAAMFGRNYKTKSSETVLHLISCGADLNQTDVKGMNCLHYSVLYSNEDTVHLLLNIGMDPNESFDSGLRAIDCAAKCGNKYLMKLLGPLTHGFTRTDLQILLLKYQKKGIGRKIIEIIVLYARFMVMFALMSVFFYAYPQYILYYLPRTSSDIAIHAVLVILNAFTIISWYKTCASDPGYLPLNTENYNKIVSDIIDCRLSAQRDERPKVNSNKNIRLCHTCRTVQTNRATHCRYCKRCIATFDHHCIYLSTCIGQNNRLSFFILGLALFMSGLLSTYLVVSVAVKEDALLTPYHWFNLGYTFHFLIIGCVLTVCNLRRAAINLTTNEELKRRYSYLTDSEGRFVNPFDRGSYLRNIIVYFTSKHYNYSKINEFKC